MTSLMVPSDCMYGRKRAPSTFIEGRTEEGVQNNQQFNHQMRLKLTLAISNAGKSLTPTWSWVSAGNNQILWSELQKTEILEHTKNSENWNRFSTFISRRRLDVEWLESTTFVLASHNMLRSLMYKIVHIAFELIALRRIFGPQKKWLPSPSRSHLFWE